jgi:predicted Zn-dependent protease
MLKGDKETAEEWQAKARVLGWKEEEGRKGAAAGGAKSNLDQGVDPDVLARQEQAVEGDPESVVARLALAGSYRKLGMPLKAVAHLREALSRDQEMSVLYLELGRSLEEANLGGEALEVYARGIPVAERKGDLMPRNQMASRQQALKKKQGAQG